jgi:hypothetical protein
MTMVVVKVEQLISGASELDEPSVRVVVKVE